MFLLLLLRLAAVMGLLVDAPLGCSDSFLPAGLAEVCPVSVALASTSCPCPVDLALAVLHRLFLLLCVVAIVVPVAAAAVRDCPKDRSDLLHGPLGLVVPAGVLMKRQIVRVQAAVPLGREEAIAGTVFPSLCSMRAVLVRCVSRLRYRRLLHPGGVVAGGCCIVT